ncbi:MAG: hypothetical protein JW963_06915 [Anaerolineales bacterium]|nr:hypothetical protein [Anaerolineales bacterium]
MSNHFCLFIFSWLRSKYARSLIVLLILVVQPGCGIPVYFGKETPLKAKMSEITPGLSTKNDIRALLGEPLYSSAAWDAELYYGYVMRQRLFDVLFPVPLGPEFELATLLVVYGPADLVSGVTYHATYGEPNCPNDCMGDTKGLEIQYLHVLLAPPAESASMVNITETADVCTLMVVAADKDLHAGVDCRLYLDQHFLQRVPNNRYFRLEIPPGKHILSCMEPSWFQNTVPRVPLPGHPLVPGKGTSVIDYPFECAAGDTRYFRLKNQGGHFIGPMKFGIEPTYKSDFLSRTQSPRLIIIPDTGSKTQ